MKSRAEPRAAESILRRPCPLHTIPFLHRRTFQLLPAKAWEGSSDRLQDLDLSDPEFEMYALEIIAQLEASPSVEDRETAAALKEREGSNQ